MNILVAGSTEWVDHETFGNALTWAANQKEGIPTLFLVPAQGAVALAKAFADHHRWPVREFKTNQEAVDARPDLVLAYPLPGSVSTWDCLRRANDARLNTHIVNARWK